MLSEIDPFILFVLIGFAAQIIDGALGMAYGIISATFLMAMGLPPATVSASVHVAEVFTTAVSGFFHFSLRNIDWRLFFRLVVPGVIGGCIGAYVLSGFPADAARPLIAIYLMVMGVVIFYRAVRKKPIVARPDPAALPLRRIAPVGLCGGFLDAAGGGGWGPIVTTNLIVRSESPRHIIGTVNLTEFFVTLSISATFILSGIRFHEETLGLLVGGVIAAPLAAWLVRLIPARRLMALVGIVIIVTSLYRLFLMLAGSP